MRTLYTIGFKGKPLRTFIDQLRKAEVDAVIDVRLRNTSHLAGYAKRDTLSFLLQEGFNIAYEHRPELAPTSEIFDAYRDTSDWVAYESHFLPLLTERDVEKIGREIYTRYHTPCLLCAEPSAERCHRRLVAQRWAESLGVNIVHL